MVENLIWIKLVNLEWKMTLNLRKTRVCLRNIWKKTNYTISAVGGGVVESAEINTDGADKTPFTVDGPTAPGVVVSVRTDKVKKEKVDAEAAKKAAAGSKKGKGKFLNAGGKGGDSGLDDFKYDVASPDDDYDFM